MSESLQMMATEAVAEALETMAFVAPMPAEPDALPTAPAIVARIEFSGPMRGVLELAGPQQLGNMLAANVLGIDSADAEAQAKGLDALRETVNVACGVLLGKLPTDGQRFEMNVPQIVDFDPATQWREFVSGGSMILDADGCVLAVRVRLTPAADPADHLPFDDRRRIAAVV